VQARQSKSNPLFGKAKPVTKPKRKDDAEVKTDSPAEPKGVRKKVPAKRKAAPPSKRESGTTKVKSIPLVPKKLKKKKKPEEQSSAPPPPPMITVVNRRPSIFETAVPKRIREIVATRPADSLGLTKFSMTGNRTLDAVVAPPQLPGLPRPVWQVMAFSVPTGFLWYGWYKFAVEEEIKTWEEEQFGGFQGFGGYATLGPFTLGLLLGPLCEQLGAPGGAAWSAVGVVWIYYTQYLLYKRVNTMYEYREMPPPLHVWWLLFPGFNLIIGLRQLHFLAAFWALERGDAPPADPVAEFFPFISAPRYTWREFLRSPRLWVAPLNRVRDLDIAVLKEDRPDS